MSTDLVLPERRAWITLMPAAAELAKQVANTEFVPKSLRGNPGAIAACVLYGDELGIGPMQALAKISVIEGRPTLSAEAQRALILAAGHDMWVVESSNTKVTIAGRRSNSDNVSTVTWTMDDAKRAGLAGRQNWRTYPRQMLTARATAELARLIFADAVGGLLATEELEGDDVDLETGEILPATSKRKRKAVAKPETSGRPQEGNGAAAELPPLPDFESSGAATDDPSAVGEPALEGTGAPSPPADPNAAGGAPDSLKPTTRQLKKLNTLVGTLRDEGRIKTEQLWSAMANSRGVAMEHMVDLLGGIYVDEGAEVPRYHWTELRESLTREEASGLIDRLERYEANVAAMSE